MLFVLSPSKTSDPNPIYVDNYTMPLFRSEINYLIDILQNKTKEEIQSWMQISNKLADQTYLWIESLSKDLNIKNSRCAIFNFTGEVYLGINPQSWSDEDTKFAQNHCRILSGLYGILRPLDLMQLYRLEMATKFVNENGKNLYHFWGDKITHALNADLKAANTDILVNLASQEYFKSINLKMLKAKVVNVNFFEIKKDKKIFISFSAKKARGLMASYIVKNRILTFEQLLDFNLEGYKLDNFDEKNNTHITFVKSS